jgi:hypothetical protein
VACSISDCTASIRLAARSELETLSSEGSLVDLTLRSTREGHSVALELVHGLRGLPAHIVDGVLIAEPIRSFDRIVSMPLIE